MAGLDFGMLGGVGLGITQGMQDRENDVKTRLDRLRLKQETQNAETDEQVKSSLKAAAAGRNGVQPQAQAATPSLWQRATSLFTGDSSAPQAQAAPSAAGASSIGQNTGTTASPGGTSDTASGTPPTAAPQAPAGQAPAAQMPQAGAAPQAQGQPAQFDGDLQIQQAQIMMNSGDPRWIQMGQQMMNGAYTMRHAQRQDQAEAGMYQALNAHNQLMQSFQGKDGAQHAIDYLMGPGAAYMNHVNYNGQNYAIMQDGKGGMVAVAHDPKGNVTAQLPVTKDNVQALATTVAQTGMMNVMGASSPEMFPKLMEYNLKQRTADAADTSALASFTTAKSHEKDTDAKINSGIYDAQAYQAKTGADASMLSARAAMVAANAHGRYYDSLIDKVNEQAKSLENKLPEAQKLYLQQVRSDSDIASKQFAQDPSNSAAKYNMQQARLKQALAYQKLGVIGKEVSPFEFAGLPSPESLVQQQLSASKDPKELNRMVLQATDRFGADYGNAVRTAAQTALAQDSTPQQKGVPGVARGSSPTPEKAAARNPIDPETSKTAPRKRGLTEADRTVSADDVASLTSSLAKGNNTSTVANRGRTIGEVRKGIQ